MSSFFPTLAQFRKNRKQNTLIENGIEALNVQRQNDDELQFKENYIHRTDRFDNDKAISDLLKRFNALNPDEIEEKNNLRHFTSRFMSVMDLTPQLYRHFNQNPNTIGFWFPRIKKTLENSNSVFKTPKTKILNLPIELAQYLRIEYADTTSASRDKFNEIIFNALGLEDDKTYFIKMGIFSSKFEFANAKCSEPREMGEYFSVINNFAMMVGAAHSNEICAREYIKDVENNPTIYNGMPLHTEYRAFVNFDTHEVYGVVPYWDNATVTNTLRRLAESNTCAVDIQKDLDTLQGHMDTMNKRFNQNVSTVHGEIQKIVNKESNLVGQWCIDIMQNGDDFYLIDMGLATNAALMELLPQDTQERIINEAPLLWFDETTLLMNDSYWIHKESLGGKLEKREGYTVAE